MRYVNEKELSDKELKIGDAIYFSINGSTWSCMVDENHLAFGGMDNDYIFKQLYVDKMEFTKTAYGYTPANTMFPEYKMGDMAAAKRVVIALWRECDKQDMAVLVDKNFMTLRQLRKCVNENNTKIELLERAKKLIEKNG